MNKSLKSSILKLSMKNSINTKDSLLFTKQTLYEMKNGLEYRIPVSTSFQLFNFINVSPSFNLTGRVYSSRIQQEERFYVVNNTITSVHENDTIYKMSYPFDFQLSVPLSTTFYGLFKINKGNVEAIRHVVKPSISFSEKILIK